MEEEIFEVRFVFETRESAEQFKAWWHDAGGDQTFGDFLDVHDIDDEEHWPVTHWPNKSKEQ